MLRKISKMGVNFLANESVVSNQPGPPGHPPRQSSPLFEDEEDEGPELPDDTPEDFEPGEKEIILSEIKILKMRLRVLETALNKIQEEFEGETDANKL